MNEQVLIDEIARLKEAILAEQDMLTDTAQTLLSELDKLLKQYSLLYAPLKPGDEFVYKPGWFKPSQLVRVISAACVEVPDEWEYTVEIVPTSQSTVKGKTICLTINRWNTPKKISH